MLQETAELFPLSKQKKIKGSRRLAREKVLQVLMAHVISETPWSTIFSHVFFREFNFGDDEEKQEKLLSKEEVDELESDIPITWDIKEIEFARALIQQTLDLGDFIDTFIKKIAQNWELERIALIDRLLMHMAAAELIKFPEIPSKVSMNEAIDISKKYSTDKSSTFINGVLDTLLDILKKEGVVTKEGKGLNEK